MRALNLDILAQPNDETCGVTCLHAIYNYFGESNNLEKLIPQIPAWESGGTLAVLLGCHALAKNYKVTIYSYNLHVFDPTWFNGKVDLQSKLKLQMQYKNEAKIHWASNAYLRFLDLGGTIKFEELNSALIRKYLNNDIPILTGLNATYLYQCAREFGNDYDDLRGTSMGHFVILSGYNREEKTVQVSDPLKANPYSPTQQYHVPMDRVINSIMLGILTFDANLLIIEKEK